MEPSLPNGVLGASMFVWGRVHLCFRFNMTKGSTSLRFQIESGPTAWAGGLGSRGWRPQLRLAQLILVIPEWVCTSINQRIGLWPKFHGAFRPDSADLKSGASHVEQPSALCFLPAASAAHSIHPGAKCEADGFGCGLCDTESITWKRIPPQWVYRTST